MRNGVEAGQKSPKDGKKKPCNMKRYTEAAQNGKHRHREEEKQLKGF